MIVWKCNKCFYMDKNERHECICGGQFTPIEIEDFIYEAIKRTFEIK